MATNAFVGARPIALNRWASTQSGGRRSMEAGRSYDFLAWLRHLCPWRARCVRRAVGAPPLALLIGLLAPLSLFLLGYRTIRPLREFVLSADLRLIVGMQAWRWAGFGFLTLYAYGVLPGI